MKRLFLSLFVLLILFSTHSKAQLQQQSIFPSLTGNELLDSLSVHFAPVTVVNYDNARNLMFSTVDNLSGLLVCIYTGDTITLPENVGDPKGFMNDNGWNTEHIWPQSKGAIVGLARSDIHHLRPIRADVNSSRSNKPFGYLEPAQVNRWWKDDMSQTTVPIGELTDWSRTGSTFFQVRDAQKGFAARAMFYFFTFYYAEAMQADPDYFLFQLENLRRYHNESYINQYEIDRTLRVEIIQGNVNPFIMDTTLVRRAFFENFDPNQAFGNTGYFVDFETGSKGGYDSGTVTLSGIQWTFSNALILGNAGDEVIGSKAARLRHQTEENAEEAFIRMDEDKANGLGVISFLYSRSNFSGDRSGTSPTILVEYSTNQGDTWLSAGAPINLAGVNSLQSANFPVNIEAPGRVRIRTISGDNGKRLNIDNFRITDFSTVVLPSLSEIGITESNQDFITLNASVINAGGGTITARGFIYSVASENNDPIISDENITLVAAGSGTGGFSATLQNLDSNIDYAVKAFATNETGTSYSEEIFIQLSEDEFIELDMAFKDSFSGTQNETFTTSGVIGESVWNVSRSGNDWGARIFNNRLELTNTASAATNANGWIFAYTSTSDFEKGYEPVLNHHHGVISWTFNMRQIRTDPSGFGTGNYGAAFVLGSTTSDVRTTGSGYAVVIGNASSPDPIRLVSFSNGLSGAQENIVTSPAGSVLENPQTGFMSIEVRFNPITGLWQLFGRLDGSAFSDPSEGELELLGEITHTTHTSTPLLYMGGYWQGSTAANQTAFFDNITVDITPLNLLFSSVVEGHAGWRIVGSPLANSDFGTLLEPFWTQGFQGADTNTGDPNVLIYDWNNPVGEEFIPINNALDLLKPGEGVLFYLFEKDDIQNGSFPKSWEISGFANMSDITVDLNPSINGFTLVSNPYPVTLDWAQVIAQNAAIKPVIYIYDHAYNGTLTGEDVSLAAGAYRTWNGVAGSLGNYLIAPFQGFWIQSDVENGSLTIPSSARVFGTASQLYNDSSAFKILAATESGIENELWLSFGEGGSLEKNSYDALALNPLEFAPHIQFHIEGELAFSSKHLPLIQEKIILNIEANPLTPNAEGYFEVHEGWVTFNWQIPTELSHLDFFLMDNLTQTTIDMREVSKYSWESFPSKNLISQYSFGSLQKLSNSSRFSISIIPADEILETQNPTQIALYQNYPNPFNPSTQIRFSLPENATVSLSVYSIEGRRVATLVEGLKTSGEHSVSFDASHLASGVYLYRLQVGNHYLTKKLMLVK